MNKQAPGVWRNKEEKIFSFGILFASIPFLWNGTNPAEEKEKETAEILFPLAVRNSERAVKNLQQTLVSLSGNDSWNAKTRADYLRDRQGGMLPWGEGPIPNGIVLLDDVQTDGDEVGDQCFTRSGISCYTHIANPACGDDPETSNPDTCTQHDENYIPCSGGGGGGGGGWPGRTPWPDSDGPPISGGDRRSGGPNLPDGGGLGFADPDGPSFTPGSGGGGFCYGLGIPTQLQINSGQPQNGKIMISVQPGDQDFPLPYQTQNRKIRLKAEYVLDWTAFLGLPGCTPVQPAPYDLNRPNLAAYLSVTFRVKDPPDSAVYAQNPSDDDNLDPNRKKGNLIIPTGYQEHPLSCTNTDAAGNVHKISVIPRFIGPVPSVLRPGLQAHRYQAEVDFEITDRYSGDNYLVEASVGWTHCVATDSDGDCISYSPAICGDPNCPPDWPNCTQIINGTSKQIGPFTAWKRIYANSIVCYRFGAELSENFVPDGDSNPDFVKVFWEQYAGQFTLGESVRVMDKDNSTGETATVASVSAVDPATNTISITLDRDLTGTYTFGYPGDPRRPSPNGRGASLIRLDPGQNTNEISQISSALSDSFIECRPTVIATNLPAFNIFPLNGVYPFNSQQGEVKAAIQARLNLWTQGISNNNSFTLINGTWIREETSVFSSGRSDPSKSWSFVSAAYWELYQSSNKIQRQKEITAHETIHMFHNGVPESIADCFHSSNIQGPEKCLMNNHDSANTAPEWEDGSVRMFQEQGLDSHHYYWIRRYINPFNGE